MFTRMCLSLDHVLDPRCLKNNQKQNKSPDPEIKNRVNC